MSTLLCDCEILSSLSLSRRNLEGASVCLWCVIQARRLKCETYLSRLIENRTDVWMCWSIMPMLGFRYSLSFDLNSTIPTYYCDPQIFIPTNCPSMIQPLRPSCLRAMQFIPLPVFF